MTKNQEKLIRFIAGYRMRYGISPTLQEMVKGINVSDHKSVSGIIASLIRSRFLDKGQQKNRSVFLTEKALDFIGVPLLRRQKAEGLNCFQNQILPTSSNDVPRSSVEYIGHGEQSIKTDGTGLFSDLRTVVGNTVANIASRVCAHKKTGEIFGWAILFGGLTWANTILIDSTTTALGWTAIETVVISFLSKKS